MLASPYSLQVRNAQDLYVMRIEWLNAINDNEINASSISFMGSTHSCLAAEEIERERERER